MRDDVTDAERIVAAINDLSNEINGDTPTLRDRFAMAALSGALDFIPTPFVGNEAAQLAASAYVLADAMMKARDDSNND